MKLLYIVPSTDRNVRISYIPSSSKESEDGLKIIFRFILLPFENCNKRDLIQKAKIIAQQKVPWLTPGFKEWIVDLDGLKQTIPESLSWHWFTGTVPVEQEFEEMFTGPLGSGQREGWVIFYITENIVSIHNAEKAAMKSVVPIEITKSLEKFASDYSSTTRKAFIMMPFGTAQNDIHKSISSSLLKQGIVGLRADDKQYHDDLYYNTLTYIYGCDFGIAVFERVEADEFNPNVSLEVGYCLGINKEVCLLKDRTLKWLHADLVGKLYRSFDVRDLDNTIERELSVWLKDKGFILP